MENSDTIILISFFVMFFIWLLPVLIILNSNKTSGKEKLAWVLAVIFVSWFAWIFYILLAPIFGVFMYVSMTIIYPLIGQKDITQKSLLFGIPLWLICGLCWGLTMRVWIVEGGND